MAAEIQLLAADASKNQGNYTDAVRDEMEAVVATAQMVGDMRTAIKAASLLTALNLGRGDLGRVTEQTIRLLQQADDHHDNHTVGLAACNLGDIARMHGDWPAAADHYQAALRAFAKNNDSSGLTTVTIRLGKHAEDRRQWPEAAAHYRRALELAQQGNRQHHQIRCLLGLAGVACNQGQIDEARSLLADLQMLSAQQPALLTPLDRALYQRLVAQTMI